MDNAAYKSNLNHFLLLASPASTPRSRIGFVIARKKVKRAIDRNRIKRVCRDYFRLLNTDRPALDIVFLARQNLADLENTVLREKLDEGFRQLTRKSLKHRQVPS